MLFLDISLGLALSVVPPIHAASPEKLNLVSLAAFVHWFRDSFPIVSGSKVWLLFSIRNSGKG
jgi:hypothetical protein